MNLDPNWASPPGETIVRLMHARELEADELASALGLSEIEFGTLLDGGRRLTRALAEVLSENLGSTVRFWMARDQSYLRDLAKLGQTDAAKESDWVRSMPLASMRRLGWLSKGARSEDAIAAELLSFLAAARCRIGEHDIRRGSVRSLSGLRQPSRPIKWQL